MNNPVMRWAKDNASTILTGVGIFGMIATVVLAIKATPEAHSKIVDAQSDKAKGAKPDDPVKPELTMTEKIQVCWQDYIPTTIVGVSTLACFLGANVLNTRQQAMLMSAYATLESTFQNYRKKVDALFGEGADAIAMRETTREQEYREDDDTPPWDAVQTFYLEGYPAFFERTMEQVKDAEYHINRNLILRGYVTFNEFLRFLGLERVEGGDEIGWNRYDGECFYGYLWIDFYHQHRVDDDGFLVCDIVMPFMPHHDEEPLVEESDGELTATAKNTACIMKGGESHEEGRTD